MEKGKKAVRIHTKITEDVFNMIISSHEKGYLPIQIAQRLGLSQSAVEKAVRHRTWAGHLEYLEGLKQRHKKRPPKENQISMAEILGEKEDQGHDAGDYDAGFLAGQIAVIEVFRDKGIMKPFMADLMIDAAKAGKLK